MKACTQCGATKTDDDFYVNCRKCKECTKANVRANRRKRIEYYRAYDRARGNRQPDGYAKEYYETHKEQLAETRRQWVKDNAAKRAAHVALGNAVRDGVVQCAEACWYCGSTPIHGHHASYASDMQLAVTWLCPKCHGAAHQIANQAARQSA